MVLEVGWLCLCFLFLIYIYVKEKENIINQLQVNNPLWTLIGFPPYNYITPKTWVDEKPSFIVKRFWFFLHPYVLVVTYMCVYIYTYTYIYMCVCGCVIYTYMYVKYIIHIFNIYIIYVCKKYIIYL